MHHETVHLDVDSPGRLARLDPDRELCRDDRGSRTWREFSLRCDEAQARCLMAGVKPGDVVVIPAAAGFEFLPWLFGAAAAGAVVVPLRPERAGEPAAWREFLRVAWRVAGDDLVPVNGGKDSVAAVRLLGRLRAANRPGLILATGGTTGTPKLVLHDLAALLAAVPLRWAHPWRILPMMRFDHIGGLDMAWRVLAGGQVLVAPPADINPDAVGSSIARHGVEVLPATPSFLNLLLLAEVPRHHDLGSLRTIPYGAEPMPAGLLARLREALPQVNFVQRFGTSETGALPVRDAAEGLLLQEGRGFAWRVVERELWVKSPSRALGYLSGSNEAFDEDGWFRTGDLADCGPDGTIRVLGRREELINVGGEKILPGEVEGLLLRHPLVADCRVGPLPNGLLGQVVAAEVVWRGPERDATVVKRLLHEFVGATASRRKLPAVVRLVAAIEATRNLKKLRTALS